MSSTKHKSGRKATTTKSAPLEKIDKRELAAHVKLLQSSRYTPAAQVLKAIKADKVFCKKLKPVRALRTNRYSLRPYQTNAVAEIGKTNFWTGELATGSGKTLIAAEAVKQEVLKGSGAVLFIGASATSLVGIADEFFQYYAQEKANIRIGDVNVVSFLNDVNFLSAAKYAGIKNKFPTLHRKLMLATKFLVVDEAHHFPRDTAQDLVIYGEITELGSRFRNHGKKVASFTATHLRTDGKAPMGTRRSGISFSYGLQEAVDDGYVVPVYGMSVFLNFTPVQVGGGEVCKLKFKHKRQHTEYCTQIADCMVTVWKSCKRPTCAFVATVQEAKCIASQFNKKTGLKSKGLRVLVGQTSTHERLSVMQDIKDGSVLGYITCHVGEESLNLPCLEVAHLIRQTKSIIRVVQAVGRVVRPYTTAAYTKKRALVVDYSVSAPKLLEFCKGLDDFATHAGNTSSRVGIAGSVVAPNKQQAILQAGTITIDLGCIRKWISAREVAVGKPQLPISAMPYKVRRKMLDWLVDAGIIEQAENKKLSFKPGKDSFNPVVQGTNGVLIPCHNMLQEYELAIYINPKGFFANLSRLSRTYDYYGTRVSQRQILKATIRRHHSWWMTWDIKEALRNCSCFATKSIKDQRSTSLREFCRETTVTWYKDRHNEYTRLLRLRKDRLEMLHWAFPKLKLFACSTRAFRSRKRILEFVDSGADKPLVGQPMYDECRRRLWNRNSSSYDPLLISAVKSAAPHFFEDLRLSPATVIKRNNTSRCSREFFTVGAQL